MIMCAVKFTGLPYGCFNTCKGKYKPAYITNFSENSCGSNEYQSGLDSGLTQSKIKDIVNTPKGSRPDPSSYLSKEYIDAHLAQFDDGASIIMTKALGFDTGHFSDSGGLVRIDIENLDGLNLRIPSGNESGANSHWIPGGKTDGGVPEAILDLIPNVSNNVTVSEIK